VTQGADGVVDLNMVYHYSKDGISGIKEMEAPSSAEVNSKTELEGALAEENLESDEEDLDEAMEGSEEEKEEGDEKLLEFIEDDDEDKLSSGGDDSEKEDDGLPDKDSLVGKEQSKMSDSGLVVVRDNIPEEEFLKALNTPGSSIAGASSRFLSVEGREAGQSSGPVAIILAPTRELAMQIHTHITAVAKHSSIKVRDLLVSP